MRTNAVFATSYISFDLEAPPFDNADVRRAMYYAVNRDELTSTVLKDIAIPAGSIIPPGYPGYNAEIVSQGRVRSGRRRKDFMAKAGYPNGEGFPEVEIWYREEGGYNGAIIPPMAQYLQAQFKDILGITMNIKIDAGQGLDGRAAQAHKNNLFICALRVRLPRSVQLLRHLLQRRPAQLPQCRLRQAASPRPTPTPNWDERVKLYAQAEQVLIDEAMIVPLVHPITMAVVSDKLSGDGVDAQLAGLHPARPAGPLLLLPPQQDSRFASTLPAAPPGSACGGTAARMPLVDIKGLKVEFAQHGARSCKRARHQFSCRRRREPRHRRRSPDPASR